MGRAVGADQSGTVDGEEYRQVLDGDIVNQLVIGALQEGGIDRHHRLHAVASHAGRQRHSMLFGDANIEILARVILRKFHHARALAHRRSDAHQPLVGTGHVAEPIAKDLGVGGGAAGGQ